METTAKSWRPKGGGSQMFLVIPSFEQLGIFQAPPASITPTKIMTN